jgi:hypothetical protein
LLFDRELAKQFAFLIEPLAYRDIRGDLDSFGGLAHNVIPHPRLGAGVRTALAECTAEPLLVVEIASQHIGTLLLVREPKKAKG